MHPGPVKYKLLHARVNRLIGDVLSTILHEQLHQLLGYYICGGDYKNATESQKQLCSYLYVRNVQLFEQVEYQGKRHTYSSYWGHGPAFQVLGRQVESNAFNTLEMRELYETFSLGWISACQCPQGEELCCLSTAAKTTSTRACRRLFSKNWIGKAT
ncbi:uncharacterized protein CC84DRAFT_765586 [Paraphaeosphaeria sporulosa]|uniref:Uncharacterized protein n=1 Tax=Paraphaeosphaeria sporulosa TaxID=1460663 RepID=A0A177CHP2_9PLEO|nr:uncharacterized protein CC84DRAFT_765586 [Paraphaeosphaeria sporulosa]OAG06482.1 hypothetical protein CC84DRAFT_765586 [Paraphaeosphaeria sporulosa]